MSKPEAGGALTVIEKTVDWSEIISQAVAAGADVSQLKELQEFRNREDEFKAKKAFARSMAGFQAECPIVTKSKSIEGRSRYAAIDDIMREIRPLLAKFGLGASFDTKIADNQITVVCTITHEEGHSITSTFAAPIDPEMRANETQRVASANTYARRYALCNALNIVASEEDDDAHALASGKLGKSQVDVIRKRIGEIEQRDTFDKAAFLKLFEVSTIDDIPESKFGLVLEKLAQKMSRGPKITPKKGEKPAEEKPPADKKAAKKADKKTTKKKEEPQEAPETAPETAPKPSEASEEPEAEITIPEAVERLLSDKWRETEGVPATLAGVRAKRSGGIQPDLLDPSPAVLAFHASYIDEIQQILLAKDIDLKVFAKQAGKQLDLTPSQILNNYGDLEKVFQYARKL